ncbi:hypothetical protein I547_1492 [Mycobacterium kansasii 824]|nr:hypothetical protein I547_1492 [Mycobacterium kansasii 824]
MLPISIDAVVGGPLDVDGAAVPLLVAVVGFPELLVAGGDWPSNCSRPARRPLHRVPVSERSRTAAAWRHECASAPRFLRGPLAGAG